MIGNYYNPSNYTPFSWQKQYGPYIPQSQTTQQAIHTGALSGLQNDYNQSIISKVNELNRRGLFGSSIANEDIGKVNYAMGQSLANLNAQEAQQQQQNLIEQQKLRQQQQQFKQQLEFQRQQQQYQQQLAQQQRIDNLKNQYGNNWWLYQ